MNNSVGTGGADRRLTTDFAAWLDEKPVTPAEFFRDGLVILDANALLVLYEVNPAVRDEAIATLSAVGDRLWVPHQAAVEFSRNRKRVVVDRTSSFKRTRESLRNSPAEAARTLYSAVEKLIKLRAKSGDQTPWDANSEGLSVAHFMTRLDGAVDAAVAELDRLSALHDLNPSDMQEIDSTLRNIDDLLVGRIGPAYHSGRLRELVEEAINFRYPNEIPPGYLDATKKTDLLRAGDFLVWQQSLERAVQPELSPRLVLLIINDLKGDWWTLDGKGTPTGARPELVQEMRDYANCHLALVSLPDFLAGMAIHLRSEISDDAVSEVRSASAEAAIVHNSTTTPADLFRLANWVSTGALSKMPPRDFEETCLLLLHALGYDSIQDAVSPDLRHANLLEGAGIFGETRIALEAKSTERVVSSQINKLRGAMVYLNAPKGVFFTTGKFSAAAEALAQVDNSIDLIDGHRLTELILEHLKRLGPTDE